MTPIQQPVPPVLDPNAAVAEMGKKHRNGKVIGYRTRSRDTTVALLTCLSAGGKRDDKSVKPETMLWGFVYLNEPGHEPRFVRNTAAESITMALGQGTPVALWDNVGELFNPVRYATVPPMEVLDLALFPELNPLADRLTDIHHEMNLLGYTEYALGPYQTCGFNPVRDATVKQEGNPPGWYTGADGYTRQIPAGLTVQKLADCVMAKAFPPVPDELMADPRTIRFLTVNGNPGLVDFREGAPWLYCWGTNTETWVSQRELTQDEADECRKISLPTPNPRHG